MRQPTIQDNARLNKEALDPRRKLHDVYGTILAVDAALPRKVMPDHQAFGILYTIGVEVVLEHIALGRTSTEIAAYFGVPQMAFSRWVETAIEFDELARATDCGADALVTRAMYVTAAKHQSSEEQRAMKDLAKQMVLAAQCLAPNRYMPSKIAGQGQAGQAPVTISVTGVGQHLNAVVQPPQQGGPALPLGVPMSVFDPQGPTGGTTPQFAPGLPPTQATQAAPTPLPTKGGASNASKHFGA